MCNGPSVANYALSGVLLVVEFIVAIDVTRARFPADAFRQLRLLATPPSWSLTLDLGAQVSQHQATQGQGGAAWEDQRVLSAFALSSSRRGARRALSSQCGARRDGCPRIGQIASCSAARGANFARPLLLVARACCGRTSMGSPFILGAANVQDGGSGWRQSKSIWALSAKAGMRPEELARCTVNSA